MNTIFVLMPMVKAHSTIKLEKSSLVNYLNMLGFGFDFSLKPSVIWPFRSDGCSLR